jgi:pimeloyl-ACP methyl ester carboxylesterase
MSLRVMRLVLSLACSLACCLGSRAQAPAAPAPAAEPAQAPAETTALAHVEVRGTGPIPMVLVPNLVCDWSIYETFMERNAARYTMYAVTLSGFGGSAPPPDPAAGASYTQGLWLENAERAVLRLVEERKLDKPVLVGQSFGGHLALRTAAARPELFRAVVAIHATPAFPLRTFGEPITREARTAAIDGDYASRVAQLSDQEWQEQQRAWMRSVVQDPARVAALSEKSASVPKSVSGRYMLEFLAADVTAELPRLTQPVLVIAGLPDSAGTDLAALRQAWPAYYAGTPTPTIVFFESSFEFITEDSPAELDRAIEQFLKGEPVQGKISLPRPAPLSPPAAPQPAPKEVTSAPIATPPAVEPPPAQEPPPAPTPPAPPPEAPPP